MSLQRYIKHQNEKVSTHFDSTEFDCQCYREDCKTTWIDLELLDKLERIRGITGKSVYILSGYRCQAHQNSMIQRGLTLTQHSQHVLGKAADIKVKVPLEELIEAAEQVGFLAIGTAKSWIHVDLRVGRVRRWTY